MNTFSFRCEVDHKEEDPYQFCIAKVVDHILGENLAKKIWYISSVVDPNLNSSDPDPAPRFHQLGSRTNLSWSKKHKEKVGDFLKTLEAIG